jgi:hypothetical protein
MEAMQTLDEMEQDESQVGQCEASISSATANTNMTLLSVPGSSSPQAPGGSTSKDSKFLRRYSCNPHGKGHTHAEQGSSSSPMPLRRSSLAAWSVSLLKNSTRHDERCFT